MTFTKDKLTTGNRTESIPQLRCLNKYDIFKIDKVYCMNMGYKNEKIEWECNTNINGKYKFHSIKISCEGYDSIEDPYILEGSCGLEYSIESTSNFSMLSVFKSLISLITFVMILKDVTNNPDLYPSQDFVAGALIGGTLIYSAKYPDRYLTYSIAYVNNR